MTENEIGWIGFNIFLCIVLLISSFLITLFKIGTVADSELQNADDIIIGFCPIYFTQLLIMLIYFIAKYGEGAVE